MTVRLTSLAVVVVVAGCDRPRIAAAPTPDLVAVAPAPPPPVELVVSARPTKVKMADLEAMIVGIEVRNHTAATIDPMLRSAQLTVNGTVPFAFGAALNNGMRDERWSSLPAGETLSISWPLGPGLFPAPGRYRVAFAAGGRTAPAIDVEVTP